MNGPDDPFRAAPLEGLVRALRAERQELRNACEEARTVRRRRPLNLPRFAGGFAVGLLILPVLFVLYVLVGLWVRGGL
jgi:hypothetical protein